MRFLTIILQLYWWVNSIDKKDFFLIEYFLISVFKLWDYARLPQCKEGSFTFYKMHVCTCAAPKMKENNIITAVLHNCTNCWAHRMKTHCCDRKCPKKSRRKHQENERSTVRSLMQSVEYKLLRTCIVAHGPYPECIHVSLLWCLLNKY